MDKYISELKNILNEKNILLNEDMSKHCSFKTGGNADIFLKPENKKEFLNTLSFLRKENLLFTLLGKGSNVLISDKGIRGVVLSTENFKELSLKEDEITSSAGVTLSEVSQLALKNSLTGFEFASGIPGSTGGGVYMNAGAYGGELKDVLKEAEVYDLKTGEIKILSNEELNLRYRGSRLHDENLILISAVFCLKKGDYDKIKEKMSELNKKRRDKQPLEYPSAGSTFKRPEGYFAAKLIEDAGLKGFSYKNARVSEKHAGFIINSGNATSEEIACLIEIVKEEVYNKFNVKLETEVRMIGEK